jgi:hypothetical protein
MIPSVWSYLRHEVLGRWSEIVGGSEFWLSVVVGAVLWWRLSWLPAADLYVHDIVGIALTYAAIALGFCVAGMTIVLTLPHDEFVARLASTKLEGKRGNGYSDLMFVFSWTAIAHWVCIVVLCIETVLSSREDIVFSAAYKDGRRVFVGMSAALVMYCFAQFLITLITLSQVARALIADQRTR